MTLIWTCLISVLVYKAELYSIYLSWEFFFRYPVKSYPDQLVPKSSRTQIVKSYPNRKSQLVPNISQLVPNISQLVPKKKIIETKSYPNRKSQLVPKIGQLVPQKNSWNKTKFPRKLMKLYYNWRSWLLW